MYILTKYDCERLAEEMQEIIMRIFQKDNNRIIRLHTEAEQQRLEQIAEILNNCKIIEATANKTPVATENKSNIEKAG